MVLARNVDGRELTFGASGKLIMNAVVLYDHQTDSLWSQFLAQAVDGPLAGTTLELLPAALTTWESWYAEHPDTLLLDRRGDFFAGGGDRYAGYFRDGSAGILGETNKDRRLPTKEKVVGLDTGATPRAYAFRDLAKQPVVNDTYDGEPIVVTFDPIAESAAVFHRDVDGQGLTFSSEDVGKMRADQTGSIWSLVSGEAIEGPLAGKQLEQAKSFVAFWFAWSDFYPGTDLFRASD